MAIGKEIGLDIDDFDQQKVLQEKDTVAQLIMNILFMKPGHMPNLPHIGIDIGQYLYKQEDEFDTNELKVAISSQCNELLPYMLSGNISIKFTEVSGVPILLIAIPIEIDSDSELLIVGLSPTDSQTLLNSNTPSVVYEFTKLV